MHRHGATLGARLLAVANRAVAPAHTRPGLNRRTGERFALACYIVCVPTISSGGWSRSVLSTVLSSSLRELLDAHVDSFEKLEVVMAMRRAPGQRCTMQQLTASHEIDRDDLRTVVGQLCASGIAREPAPGELALDPRTPELRGALDELEALYDGDRLALVKTIAESAMNRLRNLAGRAFAEAFVIRKKPGGDR